MVIKLANVGNIMETEGYETEYVGCLEQVCTSFGPGKPISLVPRIPGPGHAEFKSRALTAQG